MSHHLQALCNVAKLAPTSRPTPFPFRFPTTLRSQLLPGCSLSMPVCFHLVHTKTHILLKPGLPCHSPSDSQNIFRKAWLPFSLFSSLKKKIIHRCLLKSRLISNLISAKVLGPCTDRIVSRRPSCIGTDKRPCKALSMSNQGCVQGQRGGSAPASTLSLTQGSEALKASRGCLFGMDLGCPMAYSGRGVHASL